MRKQTKHSPEEKTNKRKIRNNLIEINDRLLKKPELGKKMTALLGPNLSGASESKMQMKDCVLVFPCVVYFCVCDTAR